MGDHEKDAWRKWREDKRIAEESKWQRVLENDELLKELRHFRQSHNIYYELHQYTQEDIDKHREELRGIAEKHGVNFSRLALRFYTLAFCGEGDDTRYFPNVAHWEALSLFVGDGNKEHVLETDPPPQPIKNGRRVDWRPVWEWYLLHPKFTIKEVADVVHVQPGSLRNEFSRIKAEMKS